MTMHMLEGEAEVRDYGLERLIMLSDGVFAIAMTLLALEVRPAHPFDGDFGRFIVELSWPFFAFFWSFLSVAILWASHRQSFSRFRRSDFGLTAYNLIVLGLITLVPAITRLVSESHYAAPLVWTYIGLFQLIGVFNALMWAHAAFFTSILKPGLSMRLKVTVTFILLLVAPLMTSLGVLTSQPGLRWTSIFIPVVAIGSAMARRWAERPGSVRLA